MREEYGKESQLITYGGDHVLPQAWDEGNNFPFKANAYSFKVARIEPENNIHLVLEAFSQIPDAQLVLVGNWEHSKYGRSLREQYASFPNLFLLDPIYDQKKLDVLRSNCRIYVHGHQAGGTNPSLVEAMNLGLPIIAFDVSFNRASMHHQGMYFSNVPQLQARLLNADEAALTLHRNTMKKLGKKYYNWSLIARQYAALIAGEKRIPEAEIGYRIPKRRSTQKPTSISLPT